MFGHIISRDVDGRLFALGDLFGDFAAQRSDFAFQVAHASLASVIARDASEGSVIDRQFALLQPVSFKLLGQQEVAGDVQFLFLGVAGQFQYFHAVAQRGWNWLQRVGGGNEHDARQVECQVQVVVPEVVVLLRVQYFQQCRRWIAAPICSDFIHLVQHDHRVIGVNTAQGLDDASRHGTDVGAAVAANLCLVADAAKRHTRKLTAKRTGNRLS